MSLKTIHIVVILLSISLSLFFGWWAIRINPDPKLFIWGILSGTLGLLLIPYLIWFILKVRRGGA